MTIQAPPMTAKEFLEFVMLRQNADHRFELIGGRVVELVSTQARSRLGAHIAHLIGVYLDKFPIGFITGADGGYQIGDDHYLPNIAFVSKSRQPVPSDEVYNSLPPDLAVEVVSPSDDIGDVLAKVNNYL